MINEKVCFYCKSVKPLSQFKVNTKKYKIKSEMGVCIGCIECTEDKEKVKQRILSKYSNRNKGWWKNEQCKRQS
jgi:hypothetical protein